jgi:diaminopimelate epimerase
MSDVSIICRNPVYRYLHGHPMQHKSLFGLIEDIRMASAVLANGDGLAHPGLRARAGIAFRKMHGLGNDFVVIDARVQPLPLGQADYARIADRRLGIGCDQLIVLEPAGDADARMRIFNPDGGEVGACGNATRCIGALLAAEKGTGVATIRTMAGLLHARIDGPEVAVDMGPPSLGWAQIPLSGPGADTARIPLDVSMIDARLPTWFSAVSMGNPHGIFFVEDADDFDLAAIGPRLEAHPIFPEKANISLVSSLGDNAFLVRVWERAAGATLACGTAACAVAVAAERLGLASGVIRIRLPGGELVISRSAEGQASKGQASKGQVSKGSAPESHVIMRGPVATSFSGMIDPSLLADPALLRTSWPDSGPGA